MVDEIISSVDYLSEEAVLARWPMLTRAELRRARKANPPQIGHYNFRGGPCFTPAQVQEYIERTYLRVPTCPTETAPLVPTDSKSANGISTAPIPTAAAAGTPAGMTPELALSAAEALKRQILNPQRSRSPRSSRAPRKAPPKRARLALVKS